MDITKFIRHGIFGLGFALTVAVLAGCQTPDPYGFDPLGGGAPPAAGTGNGQFTVTNQAPGVLQVGDEVTIGFSDLVNPVAALDEQIKSDGTITLIYDQKFVAAGKTVSELQAEIRQRYVPKYFVYMTPTLKVQDRFYTVGGEVRSPNRFLWTGGMTVLGAINTAGGFTDFSNKKKVTLTRLTGEQLKINCKTAIDHPEQDVPVYPGDKINVKKRPW